MMFLTPTFFFLSTLYHLFISAAATLLVFGLMLDNVYKTLYIYVTAVSFFGGILVFTTLSLLLVGTFICLCFCLCCCCYVPCVFMISCFGDWDNDSWICSIFMYPAVIVFSLLCQDND
jgi:hypothetical protein